MRFAVPAWYLGRSGADIDVSERLKFMQILNPWFQNFRREQ